MPQPLSLTDQEYEHVTRAAGPIHANDRGALLQAIAEALASHPVRGEGLVHRLCADLQRRFVVTARSDAELHRAELHRATRHATRSAIASMLSALPDAHERAKRACARMEAAFEDAMVEGFETSLPVCAALPDPNDAHVLAAALKTRADVLVTDSLKHFPEEITASFNIEVRSADAFIADTIALDENRAVDALGAMRARWKRPLLTVEDLFVKMEAQGLMKSVDILRPRIGPRYPTFH